MPSIPKLPILFSIGPLYEASVVKRPSSVCKTPYVADILLLSTEKESDPPHTTYLAHTAALGCGGLCEKESTILVGKTDGKVCNYTAYFSVVHGKEYRSYICIYPKLAETAVGTGLATNRFSWLSNPISVSREIMFENSRFDFAGVDSAGIQYILEVKCVPLAIEKSAYFPIGVKRKKGEVVSPRALKHIEELEKIKLNRGDNVRCILCFVVMRSDVKQFALNPNDPVYKEAVMRAQSNGVEIRVIQLHMSREGNGYLVTDSMPMIV